MMLKSVISAELYDLMIVNKSISAPVPLNFEEKTYFCCWFILCMFFTKIYICYFDLSYPSDAN